MRNFFQFHWKKFNTEFITGFLRIRADLAGSANPALAMKEG